MNVPEMEKLASDIVNCLLESEQIVKPVLKMIQATAGAECYDEQVDWLKRIVYSELAKGDTDTIRDLLNALAPDTSDAVSIGERLSRIDRERGRDA